jgi:hypothetical protein
MDRDKIEPTLSKQEIVALMERPNRMRLDWLIKEFPEELHAICGLEPLRSSPNLIPFLTQLTAIIYLFRAKYEDFHDVMKAAHELEKGVAHIKRAMQGFAYVNFFLLRAALRETGEKCPHLMGLDAKQLLELLDDFCVLSSDIGEVLRSAAHIDLQPRGRGDKQAYYFVPTVPLIELWESVAGKKVPTPKKIPEASHGGKKQTFISKQPSTEFIRIALRMIDPTITDAQVFTAIKRALKMNELFAPCLRRSHFVWLWQNN